VWETRWGEFPAAGAVALGPPAASTQQLEAATPRDERGCAAYWLDESGPDELVRQVRAAEAVDPDGRQWPGTKRSDDATAVYLVIDGSTYRALGVCQPGQQAALRPAAANGLGVQLRPVEHRQADDAVARGAAIAKCRDRRRHSDPLG
jgi:hypothetical protein